MERVSFKTRFSSHPGSESVSGVCHIKKNVMGGEFLNLKLSSLQRLAQVGFDFDSDSELELEWV